MADQVPVTATYLSDIERGLKLPALEVLISIADILNVTLDELLRDVFPSSADRYARMIINLFSRCDDHEARILYTVLYSVYDTLQEDPDSL